MLVPAVPFHRPEMALPDQAVAARRNGRRRPLTLRPVRAWSPMGLGLDPIPSLVEPLEERGIKVLVMI